MGSTGWRVVGASVCGEGHERVGLPCQDAHDWTVANNDFLVIAVADGAGSVEFAEVGARVAVQSAVRFISQKIQDAPDAARDDQQWQDLLAQCLEAAKAEVEAEAGKRSQPHSHFASTLVVTVAGRGFVVAAQVGDGSIIVVEPGGRMFPLTRSAQSEYLNETVFLTSPEGIAGRQTGVWRGRPAGLAVLSDGLQMAALSMPSGEPHLGFFNPLFNLVEREEDLETARQALATLLGSPRMRQRTDDDVTLVLAVPTA